VKPLGSAQGFSFFFFLENERTRKKARILNLVSAFFLFLQL